MCGPTGKLGCLLVNFGANIDAGQVVDVTVRILSVPYKENRYGCPTRSVTTLNLFGGRLPLISA